MNLLARGRAEGLLEGKLHALQRCEVVEESAVGVCEGGGGRSDGFFVQVFFVHIVEYVNRRRQLLVRGELLRERVHNRSHGADEVEVDDGAPCRLLCLERGFGVCELEVLRGRAQEAAAGIGC